MQLRALSRTPRPVRYGRAEQGGTPSKFHPEIDTRKTRKCGGSWGSLVVGHGAGHI